MNNFHNNNNNNILWIKDIIYFGPSAMLLIHGDSDTLYWVLGCEVL